MEMDPEETADFIYKLRMMCEDRGMRFYPPKKVLQEKSTLPTDIENTVFDIHLYLSNTLFYEDSWYF